MKCVILIISLLTLFLLSIAGLNTQKSQSETRNFTIVKGEIKNSEDAFIDLYAYPDIFQKYINKKILIASSPVDNKGKFEFEFNFNNASAFDLKIGNRMLASNLFLCPGDQIILKFSNSSTNTKITLNDKGGRNNQFLLLFNEKFYNENNTKRDYYINSNFLNADEYSEFLKGRQLQEKKFYDEFFSKSSPGKEFEIYVKSEIQYQYAVDKLMYLWKKGIKNKQTHAGSDYYDFLSNEFIENPSALDSPSYVHFLNLYFSNLYEQQLLKIQQNKKAKQVDQAFEKIMFAKKTFSGLSLHIIILNILNEEVNSVDYIKR